MRFGLPSGNAAPPPNSSATCVYWNATLQGYSNVGCIALPNPSPRGVALAFPPNASAPTDAALAGLWTATGGVAANCLSTVIDCSSPDWTPQYPDLADPFGYPAITCPNISSNPARWTPAGSLAPPTPPSLRVFSGARCALFRPGNAANCYWDATLQVFTGAGCVASVAPADCACRHLTGAWACVFVLSNLALS